MTYYIILAIAVAVIGTIIGCIVGLFKDEHDGFIVFIVCCFLAIGIIAGAYIDGPAKTYKHKKDAIAVANGDITVVEIIRKESGFYSSGGILSATANRAYYVEYELPITYEDSDGNIIEETVIGREYITESMFDEISVGDKFDVKNKRRIADNEDDLLQQGLIYEAKGV